MKIRHILKSVSRIAAVILVISAATSHVFAQSGGLEPEPKVLMIFFGDRSQEMIVEVEVLRDMFPTVPIDWIQANDPQDLETKLQEYKGSPRYFVLSGHGPNSISDQYSFGGHQFDAVYSKFQERFPYKAQVYLDSCKAGMNNNIKPQWRGSALGPDDTLYHAAQYFPGNGVVNNKLNIYSHFGNKDVFFPTLSANTIGLRSPEESKLGLTANFFDYLKDNLANGSVGGFYKELSPALPQKHHTIVADDSMYIDPKGPEDSTIDEHYVYYEYTPGYLTPEYYEEVEFPRVVENALGENKVPLSVEYQDYWPAMERNGELTAAPFQVRMVRVTTIEKYPVSKGMPVDELEKFPRIAEKLRESEVPLDVSISDSWPLDLWGNPGPAQLRTVRVTTKDKYPVFRREPQGKEEEEVIEQYPFYVPGTKE
jgi:hypothetical protein